MTQYRHHYRVESSRLPHWDYTRAGWYFVTLCAHHGAEVFGRIVDGAMHLSAIGRIVGEEWVRTPEVRPNVTLDEWVVMPNHLHGIVVIRGDGATSARPDTETPHRGVSTLKAGSLGAIIGQFKSVCTKRLHAEGYAAFAWQPRFRDHVIRDDRSLDRIRQYIGAASKVVAASDLESYRPRPRTCSALCGGPETTRRRSTGPSLRMRGPPLRPPARPC